MLTSLEPPSPASSAGPREVERSHQTTPQLQEALPMTSPPHSCPEQHPDAAKSSRVTPFFKRLQTRFKKTDKKQAVQPPDRLSTETGQPVNLSPDSQSQPTAQKGLSSMAETRRQRVSVFFFGRQHVYGMSDEVSQRTVSRAVKWVRCSVCSLAPLFILRRSIKEI